MLFKGFGIEITEDQNVTSHVDVPLGYLIGVLHVGNLSRSSEVAFGGVRKILWWADIQVERNNGPRRALCSRLKHHERVRAITGVACARFLESRCRYGS